MLKSDFVAKMIEKFKKALEEIKKLKGMGKYEEAVNVIDDTLKDLFRLNINSFNSLSDDYILEMIKVKGDVEADRCIIISVLLEEEAEILHFQDNENQSHYIYTKSLNMLLEAFLANSTPELVEYYEHIPLLIEKINDYKISEKTTYKLFLYNYEAGNYAKAEDKLYELLELRNFDSELVSEGIEFYERLLKLDDAILENGDLPRNEIDEALEELKTYI